MTPIEFQLATTRDLSLPLRKWWHSTRWGVSRRFAAWELASGSIVNTHQKDEAVVYEFSDGTFVRVALMGKLDRPCKRMVDGGVGYANS